MVVLFTTSLLRQRLRDCLLRAPGRLRCRYILLRLRRSTSLSTNRLRTIRSARRSCSRRRSVSGTGLLGSRSRTASPPLRLRRLSSLPRKRAHPLGACCARDRDDAALRQRHGIASCSLTVLPLTRLAVDPRYRGKTDSLKSRGARLSYFTTSLLCQRLGIALLPDGFAVIAPPRLSSLPRGRLNRFNLFDDRDLHVHGAARLQQWHGAISRSRAAPPSLRTLRLSSLPRKQTKRLGQRVGCILRARSDPAPSVAWDCFALPDGYAFIAPSGCCVSVALSIALSKKPPQISVAMFSSTLLRSCFVASFVMDCWWSIPWLLRVGCCGSCHCEVPTALFNSFPSLRRCLSSILL